MPEMNPMKSIRIPLLDDITLQDSLKKVSNCLDNLVRIPIQCLPWKSFSYTPEVFFSIGYNDAIFIKYYVQEDNLKIVYRESNDPVYKDSCVEFFVAFNDGLDYYNLEFNSIGTCLLGYGSSRNNRVFLDPETISQIKTESVITVRQDGSDKLINWELTLIIPYCVFSFDSLKEMKGLNAKANFFKCGEETRERHYLAWNCIHSTELDFHKIDHFGSLIFQ
jgi:Carbohydrate-binding family 9